MATDPIRPRPRWLTRSGTAPTTEACAGDGDPAAPARPVGTGRSRAGPTRPHRRAATEEDRTESIEQPAKVMRIGSMVKQLLEEVRSAPLDEASRARLREIYEQSIRELAEGLSPDLAAELDRWFDSLRRLGSVRGRAAGGPRPAGGVARGSLPRHPGHPGGPAGGGPGPAGRDAPAVAAPGRRARMAAGPAPICDPRPST